LGGGHAANTTQKANNTATANATQKVNSTATAKTTPANTTTPVKTTASPTITPTPTQQFYSSTDIGNHLLDIAFGPNNNVIQKVSGNALPVAVTGSYTDADVAGLNTVISQFNINSGTSHLAQNVSLTSGGSTGIRLAFLPEAQLEQLPVQNTSVSFRNDQTGDYYIIQTGQYEFVGQGQTTAKTYINSDLKGNDRKRWTLRALFYALGFTGETTKYPDSLFYAGANNVTQPSSIDWDAIQLMYGNKIINGMTKSTVRSLI
jgi:hypothetical protein